MEGEATLFVRDICWKVVQNMPPNQLFETFHCAALLVNWLIAMSLTIDQSPALTAVQLASNIVVCSIAIAEVGLKIGAYELLGYLSSASDVVDLAVAVAQAGGLLTSLLILPAVGVDADPKLLLFVSRAASLFAMYRLPRLLTNWRFFRRALLPTRALLQTLLVSLPGLLNVLTSATHSARSTRCTSPLCTSDSLCTVCVAQVFALVTLLIYIYAVLGVFWFASVPLEPNGVHTARTQCTTHTRAPPLGAAADSVHRVWRRREHGPLGPSQLLQPRHLRAHAVPRAHGRRVGADHGRLHDGCGRRAHHHVDAAERRLLHDVHAGQLLRHQPDRRRDTRQGDRRVL